MESKMFEMRNLNRLYNFTNQISWDQNDKQNDGKPFLKIWVNFLYLEKFVNLIGIDFETRINCTLTNDSIYIEMDDQDVCNFLDFENVQEVIDKACIKKY